jgi:predicted DNA-binding transcriptional regulator AlpA
MIHRLEKLVDNSRFTIVRSVFGDMIDTKASGTPSFGRATMKQTSLWPRGLSRDQAATYLGISRTSFQKLVDAGTMPRGKRITKGRVVWDRAELDHHFDHIDEDKKEEKHVHLR